VGGHGEGSRDCTFTRCPALPPTAPCCSKTSVLRGPSASTRSHISFQSQLLSALLALAPSSTTEPPGSPALRRESPPTTSLNSSPSSNLTTKSLSLQLPWLPVIYLFNITLSTTNVPGFHIVLRDKDGFESLDSREFELDLGTQRLLSLSEPAHKLPRVLLAGLWNTEHAALQRTAKLTAAY
jgi:hypothetical protein